MPDADPTNTNTNTNASSYAPLATERLTLRELAEADAPFVLELVNDPDWLRNIGDRGVRSLDDARAYIANGPQASYARFGFGLWRVGLADTDAPIGICGLLKRDTLDDVDIGFAFLPAHRGKGYALEAANATLACARDRVGLKRIVGIVSPHNTASIALLERLGMRFEKMLSVPDKNDTALYGCSL